MMISNAPSIAKGNQRGKNTQNQEKLSGKTLTNFKVKKTINVTIPILVNGKVDIWTAFLLSMMFLQ